MHYRRHCLSLFAAAALAAVLPHAASAQAWPTRPLTMVVPFAAGTGPDIVGRMLAQDLGDRLGQRVIVENRAGASGNIGAMAVARAPADGYTLLLSTPYPMGFNKLMSSDLKFDPETDLAPVIVVGKTPQIIVAGPKSRAKTLAELMELAKAEPGKLSAGIPGIGTTGHLAIEALLSMRGTSMIMVPYRGAPPMADVLSGQIDVAVGLSQSYAGAAESGQLVGLAVTSAKRSAHLPKVPTADEAGFPGFEVTAWYVLAAPAGTPRDIVQKVNAAMNGFIASDKGRAQFLPLDLQAGGGTPEEAKAFVTSEMEKWGPVIKKANIRM